MSDYIPITQELRDDVVTDASFEAHCDKIDALYKSLEKQNEELRKELNERPVACDAEVMAFVNRLRDAAERHEDVTLWGVDYTAYPVDKHGQQWHLRDMAEDTSGHHAGRREVYALRMDLHGWDIECRECGGYGCVTGDAGAFSHHRQTVSDILRQFADDIITFCTSVEDHECVDAIEEFSKRLRLAEEES